MSPELPTEIESRAKIDGMETLKQYVEFLRIIRNHKDKSIVKTVYLINKIESQLGKSLLDVTKGSEVEQVIIEVAKHRKIKFNGGYQDDGATYRFRLSMTVCNYLKWAYRERLIDRNPYPENSFREPPTREAKWLNDDQLNILFSEERLSIQNHAMVRLMLDTAIRRAELCDLLLSDVHIEERSVLIRMGKNDKHRAVPFTEQTQHWMKIYLSMRKDRGDYVFSGVNGQRLNEALIGKWFHDISCVVGFRVSAHMLRHTAGRLWAEAGINQGIIQRYMGHDDPGMTSHYIHTTSKQLAIIQSEVMSHSKRKAPVSKTLN